MSRRVLRLRARPQSSRSIFPRVHASAVKDGAAGGAAATDLNGPRELPAAPSPSRLPCSIPLRGRGRRRISRRGVDGRAFRARPPGLHPGASFSPPATAILTSPVRCHSSRLPALRWAPLHLTGLLAMATEPPPKEKKKAPLPKVVTLNKALKLAQTWVDKMSASDPDEPNDKDFEGRPSRLGLGAKAAPGVKRAAPTDPVERKLLGKVNVQKRRSMEEENKTGKDVSSDDDSDEPESRTSAFNKKRASLPMPSVTSMPSGKKAK